MREIVHKMSFSGADINVYVMVSPEALFKKQKELATSGDKTLFSNFSSLADIDYSLGETKNNTSPLVGKVKPFSNPFLGDIKQEAMQPLKFEQMSQINKETIDSLLTFNNSFKKLAELQTISYSIYRDKEQVKALGQATPKGYTRGFVTIAGTMIFTVFYEAVLAELFKNSFIDGYYNGTRIDQLPPLDLFITFTNEQGDISKLGIFGVEFMNEGQVMSIQDLITENSVNYVARHITRLEGVDSPYSISEDVFGFTNNGYSRLSLAPGEIKKAADEIKAEKQRFL